MSDLLAAIRSKIGAAPRRIPKQDRAYFLTRPPCWIDASDRLLDFYRNQEFLLTHGAVTWGAFAYTDFHAYEPGPCDVPGVLVTVGDASIEPDPGRLQRVAREFYILREDRIDQSETNYEAWTETSTPRVMAERVPSSLAQGLPLRATTLMIRRAHRPMGLMIGGVAPLLVHPDCPTAMIVPSRAWPEQYARQWRAEITGYPSIAVIDDFVRMTKGGADLLRKMMREDNVSPDSTYVYLWVREPTDGFRRAPVEIEFKRTMDPERHLLSQSLGLKIIIENHQADLLAGLLFGKNQPLID